MATFSPYVLAALNKAAKAARDSVKKLDFPMYQVPSATERQDSKISDLEHEKFYR
jgi:hypothetical protein